MKTVKKATNIFFWMILLIIAAWTLFNVISKVIRPTEYPMLFGYSEAGVATGSMEPTISQGDHIVFRKQAGYEINDIVVYYDEADGAFVAHRIVGINNGKFIMQGDYNPTCDPTPIAPENIQGKVILIIPDLQAYLLIGFGSLATIAVQLLANAVRSFVRNKFEEEGAENNEK